MMQSKNKEENTEYYQQPHNKSEKTFQMIENVFRIADGKGLYQFVNEEEKQDAARGAAEHSAWVCVCQDRQSRGRRWQGRGIWGRKMIEQTRRKGKAGGSGAAMVGMICFIIEVIGAHAVFMLMGGVAVMIMVFSCRLIVMPAVFVGFAWVSRGGKRKKKH